MFATLKRWIFGCHRGAALIFSRRRGVRENECDNEDVEDEMKRRFGTTVCKTPGMAYNTNEMILPGLGFSPFTPDTRTGATQNEVKVE